MKYPKLLLLLCTFVLAYLLFEQSFFDWIGHRLNGRGYVSIFLAGLLFSFSFTTAFATALFIEMAPEVNPLLAAPLAGLGALLADATIFAFIRFSFEEELLELKSTRLIQWLRAVLYHPSFSERLRMYLLWSVAGLIIASPLPDELGVSLLSSATEVRSRPFLLFCFAVNTIGVFLILEAARAIAGVSS